MLDRSQAAGGTDPANANPAGTDAHLGTNPTSGTASPDYANPAGGTDTHGTGDRAASVAPSGGSASDWTPNATVERVVDGDTIIVDVDGRSESVRLIGIDTPESVSYTRPVECYSHEASLHLEQLLPVGTGVTLVRDVEARDAYDRLLGYVVRSSDGLFVNFEMVVGGFAAILSYPPNDFYADAFARAESEATAAGRGLWGACGGPDVPLE